MDESHWTPEFALIYAVFYDNVSLFNNMINVNVVDPCQCVREGGNLWHWVSSVEIANKLMKYQLDINLVNDFGYTPLHNAVKAARYDIVKILLDFGADHTIPDRFGIIPCDMARNHGYFEMVKLFDSYDIPTKGVHE